MIVGNGTELRIALESGENDLGFAAAGANVSILVDSANVGSFDPAVIDELLINGNSGDNGINMSGIPLGAISSTTVHGGAGDDTVTGSMANDLIILGDGDDIGAGGGQSDTVEGNNGNDTLMGNSHPDDLQGGNGDDELNGQGGADTCDGGQGDDICHDDENNPPIVTHSNGPVVQSIKGQTQVSLDVKADDGNTPANANSPSQGITWTATGLPPGAAYITMPDSGRFHRARFGTLDPNVFTTVGSYSVKITATDDGTPPKSDEFQITWNILANVKPTITAAATYTHFEGEKIDVEVTVDDGNTGASRTTPDQRVTTFTVTGLPPGLAFTPTNPAVDRLHRGKITGTVAAGAAGTHTVTVTFVDDGGAPNTDTHTINWTITDGSPIITAPATLTHVEGETIEVKIAVDDGNTPATATAPGQTLTTFTVAGLPPGLTFTPTNPATDRLHRGTITGRLNSASAGTHTLTITAVDNGSAPNNTDTHTITWTISNFAVKLIALKFLDEKEVIADPGSGNQYGGWHWVDSTLVPPGDVDPYIYWVGKAVKVDADFLSSNAWPNKEQLEFRANGPGTRDGEISDQTNANPQLQIPVITLNGAFDKPAYIDKFKIIWEFSIDGGTIWEVAGTSSNPIYITNKKPLNKDAELLRTVVHVGTKAAEAAFAASTNSTPAVTLTDTLVFEKVWEKFASRSVTRWNGGATLTYYGKSPPTSNTITDGLINHDVTNGGGDGQCASWNLFLIDTSRTQGLQMGKFEITTSGRQLNHNGKTVTVDGFAVKDSAAPGAGQIVDRSTLARGANGLIGQGGALPTEYRFIRHFVASWDGRIYDASYGTDYDNQADWIDASVAYVWFTNGATKWAMEPQSGDIDFNPVIP